MGTAAREVRRYGAGESAEPGGRGRGWSKYREVLSVPVGRRLAVGGLVGRLREGGSSIAILLSVRYSGETLHTAALSSGAYLFCAAVSRPPQGKLLARFGHRRVLCAFSAVNTTILCARAGVLLVRAGVPATLALVSLTGLTLPAVTVSLRSSWPIAVPKASLTATAYALDGSLYQAAQVAGPALVGAMSAIAAPGYALVVLALFGLAGTSIVARATPLGPTGTSEGRTAAKKQRPSIAILLIANVFMGIFQGTLLLLATALALRAGDVPASGLLLSCVSLGSLAGGLAYGAYRWKAPAQRRTAVASAALIGAGLALNAPLPLGALAGLLGLVGVARAATNTSILLVAQGRLPLPEQAVGFAWLSLATKIGESAGAALAGVAIAAGGSKAGGWQVLAAATGVAFACRLGPLRHRHRRRWGRW
jgi:MFS family permease